MASYFDPFIVTQIINNYFTDCFLIIFFTVFIYFLISNYLFVIPSRFQSIFEIIFEHWVTVVEENLGKDYKFYVLPLFTLFLFILGLNLLGFFAYTFTPTTHISITFGMAFSVWIGVIILGFFKFRSSFFSMFMPYGAPLGMSPFLVVIEIASNVSRPIALGMRLAANLTSGHVLLAILSDFGWKLIVSTYGITVLLPIIIISLMCLLEVGVLVIQAYVFCLLSMIYIKDSSELH